LVNELVAAQDAHQLPRFLNAALRQQVIILDELGFIPLTQTGAQLIFQFCSTLYERVALIVTTNLRFADWVQVFGDERLTAGRIRIASDNGCSVRANRTAGEKPRAVGSVDNAPQTSRCHANSVCPLPTARRRRRRWSPFRLSSGPLFG